jgi:hypothetical protein
MTTLTLPLTLNTWNPADSGDWTVASDWSAGTVAGASNEAEFTGGTADYTITLASSDTINLGTLTNVAGSEALWVNDSYVTLDISGTLTAGKKSDASAEISAGTINVESGGSLVLADGLTLAGGTLNVLAGGYGTIANAFTLNTGVQQSGGELNVAAGTLAVAAQYLMSGGEMEVGAGGLITIAGVSGLSLTENGGTIAVNGGTLTVNANLIQNTGGVIDISGGTMSVGTSLAETDSTVVIGDGTLEAANFIQDTLGLSSLVFDASGGALDLGGVGGNQVTVTMGGGFDDSVSLANETNLKHMTLTDFEAGDTLNVTTTAAVTGETLSYNATSKVLTFNATLAGGATLASDYLYITAPGTVKTSDFTFTTVGTTGFEITDDVPCFMAGTRIMTALGPVAVEDLVPGCRVRTVSGGLLPLRWLGRAEVSTRFADKLRVLPIRIKAGALGGGLPERDLLVSPCHAMFVGGVLVEAGALVNGQSILREAEVPEVFTYYHVELASHELILAEGAATESFIDQAGRMNFGNWAERGAVGGPMMEMAYPRAKAQRQVPMAVRRMLAA